VPPSIAYDFLIKRYPEGKLSRHIHDMKLGERLSADGPIPGSIKLANLKGTVLLIGGGTGVLSCGTRLLPSFAATALHSPCVSCFAVDLISQITAENSALAMVHPCKLLLLASFATPQDVIGREWFEQRSKSRAFDVVVYVQRHTPADSWSGPTGYFSRTALLKIVSAGVSRVFLCGPSRFEASVKSVLASFPKPPKISLM
jgi:cytochrome-b5 reductase